MIEKFTIASVLTLFVLKTTTWHDEIVVAIVLAYPSGVNPEISTFGMKLVVKNGVNVNL